MHAAIRKLVPRDLWGRNAGDVADELHFVAFFHGLVPTRPLVHDLWWHYTRGLKCEKKILKCIKVFILCHCLFAFCGTSTHNWLYITEYYQVDILKLMPLVKYFWKSVYEDKSYNSMKMLQIGGHDGLMTSASLFAMYTKMSNMLFSLLNYFFTWFSFKYHLIMR